MSGLHWYAAYTKARHERIVAEGLQQRGFEVVFPRYTALKQWSDRVKQVEMPLFPCYIFLRFDSQDRLPVLQTPSLVHIVSDGSGPLPVAPCEVENLRRAMESGAVLQPVPYLTAGDSVFITCGPLRGLRGILLEGGNKTRVVVSVELLARSVAVELEAAWLERATRRVACTHAVVA